MKNNHTALVLAGCLLALQPVLMPAVNAADDERVYSPDAGVRGTDDVFWTIPPVSRQWDRPARTQYWTIPSIGQRWENPQEPLRWTIPRTADDMK